MLATNTGITLRWPDDYAATSDQFRARVFRDYRPRNPIYFAITVDPASMEDVKGHLLQKGQVYLVVGQDVPPGQEFDGPATTDIFLHRLKLKSTLDPKVVKDENEVGLLATYAKTFLDLAQYAASIGDTATCIKASDDAVRLGLDPGRRAQVMFMTSKTLADVGEVDKAQSYLDSAAKMLNQDGSARAAVAWTQAVIDRAKGKYAAAESLYLTLVPIAPELYWELSDLYRTGFRDHTRAEAALETWYGKVTPDWPNTSRYIEGLVSRFGDRARARQVLDAWIKKNPKDSAAATLRRTI
jgi:tetratricopeptide (TPR) repeat protein